MFEVGFLELALIFVVALVVLGPKRLPGLVRQVGRWIGKARSMARDFREQLEHEVNIEELNRMTTKGEREARGATTPPPPPEFSGEPPPAAAEPDAPVTDDSYSHAHAAGEPPAPWEPEEEGADTGEKKNEPAA